MLKFVLLATLGYAALADAPAAGPSDYGLVEGRTYMYLGMAKGDPSALNEVRVWYCGRNGEYEGSALD